MIIIVIIIMTMTINNKTDNNSNSKPTDLDIPTVIGNKINYLKRQYSDGVRKHK